MNSNNILDDHIAQIGILHASNKGGGRAVLNADKYIARLVKQTRIRGRKLPCHTHARNQFNLAGVMLYTLFDRYSKVTIGSQDAIDDLTDCFETFATKFCRDIPYETCKNPPTHELSIRFLANCGPRATALFNHISNRTTPDDFTIHYTAYLRALQEKNLPPEILQKEIDDFSSFIDFFAKRQAKPDIRHFYDTRMKASQGVSAFQKHVNALLASYSRQMAEALHYILLPNVILASNRSDAEIGGLIAEIINSTDPQYDVENFANDFTEYDSSQYSLSPMANSIFMSMFHAPDPIIDIYLSMRSNWRLNDDMVKFYGSQKMHSGEPFTLVGNTFFGMLVISFVLDFDFLCYAVFKGDDSALNGINLRFSANAQSWTKNRGLQLKDEYPPFMEFASFLITKYGFFPDVLRKCTKFLSTVFRDFKHYRESVLNLSADLACINSAEHVSHGCIALAAYYNWLGRTDYIYPSDIYMMLGFLQNQVNVQYEDLPVYDKETMFDYTNYYL
jgi:hypothetical protein